MSKQITSFNQAGLNLYVNPLLPKNAPEDGQIIRSVNLDSYPYGAKMKRPGYVNFAAGTMPNGSAVIDLFSWTQDNGTSLNVYANAGGRLYYSAQGTGAWAITGNGTLTAGSHAGYTVLNNTLVISQNGGTTRHSTNGTSFSDTSGAPAGPYLEQYRNRVNITGTSSVVSYSVTGDPTNWNTSGTSDGGNFTVPGAGLPNKLFKLADRLFTSKQYQQLFRWDDFSLVDMASRSGLSSPYSYGTYEGNGFWMNREGLYTANGGQPQHISLPIDNLLFNEAGTAIAGTSFDSAPGGVLRSDWYLAIGTTTDDITKETISNAIIKYNFLKNEYLTYSFANIPTAFHTYKDASGSLQMIFGDSSANCFTYGGTALSDNGSPIEVSYELTFDYNAPYFEKDWRFFWGFFNPGCKAQILIATSDTFDPTNKRWIPIGDATSGVVFYRFPSDIRSRFLYLKIIENSTNSRFIFYGCALDAEIVSLP